MVCDKQEYFTHLRLCLYKIETLHLVDFDSAWDCTHQEIRKNQEKNRIKKHFCSTNYYALSKPVLLELDVYSLALLRFLLNVQSNICLFMLSTGLFEE